MRLLLNGRELSGVLPGDATLGVALLEVQKHHISEDEVIAAVAIDGQPLTAERLSDWKDRPVSEFSETHIEAPLRKLLAADGLRVLSEGLRESQSTRLEIVEGVSQGRTGEAMERLSVYIGTWDIAQKSMSSACRLLDFDIDGIDRTGDLSGYPAEVCAMLEGVGRLTDQLQEVKSALEASDLVLLGDILDYEFGEITDQWCSMLDSLAGHFEGRV